MRTTNDKMVNGIDTEGLRGAIAAIAAEPARGAAAFRVRTAWKGGAKTESAVDGFSLGGERIERKFRISTDEPNELFGTNSAPNPQEVLMAALNGCMVVGWVALAALRGIRLDSLEIETDGRLDLRGFLGIDSSVAPGYETVRYCVRVRGDASPETFAEIHEAVKATSPNYFNFSRPIVLEGELQVG